MSRFLREPLVHFLAIAALMFGVYAVVSDRGSDAGTIVVGQGEIGMMTSVFERTWQRAPTPEELKGLIDGYVRDEILYREGVAMGLDRDDPLVRRRVRQKVEYLAESMHGVPEPDEAALEAYLHAHGDRYAIPARITFRQVYLGTTTDADTQGLLARLNKMGDSDATAQFGVATQLDARMNEAPTPDIERVFGRQFTQVLIAMPVGAWSGPLSSEYGLHLVRVNERTETRLPELAEVREIVTRDWQRDELAAANEKYYEALLARHTVRIEYPEYSRVAAAQ